MIGGRPGPLDADYAALVAARHVFVTGTAGSAAGSTAFTGLIVLVPGDAALVVENVAVHPSRHGQGIGRRLLAFAEEQARHRSLPTIRLYTHERMAGNIELYRRLGYREDRREPIPGGHLVHLSKPLRACS